MQFEGKKFEIFYQHCLLLDRIVMFYLFLFCSVLFWGDSIQKLEECVRLQLVVLITWGKGSCLSIMFCAVFQTSWIPEGEPIIKSLLGASWQGYLHPLFLTSYKVF